MSTQNLAPKSGTTEVNAEHANIVIDKLVHLIQQKHVAAEAKLLIRFANQYFNNIADDELDNIDIIDLYAITMHQWTFLSKRQKGEIKIQIFNPSVEKNGWESNHTIIEVVADDMPFIVDSLTMALDHLGHHIYFVLHAGNLQLLRDKNHRIQSFAQPTDKTNPYITVDAPIYIEIGRLPSNKAIFRKLKSALMDVLNDVITIVDDFQPMKKNLLEEIATLKSLTSFQGKKRERKETIDFLAWLDKDHFTFLGYTEVVLTNKRPPLKVEQLSDTKLGLLKDTKQYGRAGFFSGLQTAKDVVLSPNSILLLSKSNHLSSVHRPSLMDVISVKHFNRKGQVVGEGRFIGLFTSAAYNMNPQLIPILRQKLNYIMKHSKLDPKGHDGKALLNIVENYPRDELFQMDPKDLLLTTLSILKIQGRQRIRLFVRQDTYYRYFFCMVFVPKEKYNTALRLKFQYILMRELGGNDVKYIPHISDDVLCRIDYIIHTDPKTAKESHSVKTIERMLVASARDWTEDLRDALVDTHGENEGYALYEAYVDAFPSGFRETFLAPAAVIDIEQIEKVKKNKAMLGMNFYRMLEAPEDIFQFKLFRWSQGLALTDVFPILENMGLKVIEERPYNITLSENEAAWISDFTMRAAKKSVQLDHVRDVFQEAFAKVWGKQAENDGFNQLVMSAGISWREIVVLRVYAKYLIQINFHYRTRDIESAFSEHANISTLLVKLFNAKFNPTLFETHQQRVTSCDRIEKDILGHLEQVNRIDYDQIFRCFLDLIKATIRTNYYQVHDNGNVKNYVVIKFNAEDIPELSGLRPKFETYVYSLHFEGIHLRSALISRGGIRASGRPDFRNEVLDLMNTQQVKNAIIVPHGGKGGFFVKNIAEISSKQAQRKETIECYKTFMSGLLDITDNLINGKVIIPNNVIRYDENDIYNPVAADKGTADLSDTANKIAAGYDYWMGDAFASGGSHGYDHKKLGITARGAWESVKRHFMEIGKDIKKEAFSVIGIGDMAGDVFGNGMLLSNKIKLIAAFNHMHIFIDPTPSMAKSYEERKRLFNLPGSTWADYDENILSKGGAVFDRAMKLISLTPEIKYLLHIRKDSIEPNELIHAILKSHVDLLFNGGIGTYVKASTESHFDLTDRANDQLRVNGEELKCRVVVEGGNLGFTQQGRIEFALNGGAIYTDFIDNCAGVDCSDHEVNIKILLTNAMAKQKLTLKERNTLLASMDDEVCSLVLKNNYNQTQAIGNVLRQGSSTIGLYLRLMRELEREAYLSREQQGLPDDKAFKARYAAGKGLTAPEFCVLMAYSKIVTKQLILESSLPDDPYFQRFLIGAFPKVLQERFFSLIAEHPLAKEIIVTELVNMMVKYMGITHVHRLYDETGATPSQVAKSFVIAYEIFDIQSVWSEIEHLDGKIPADAQRAMMNTVCRLIRRVCRWLLRKYRSNLDVPKLIELFGPKVKQLREWMPKLLSKEELKIRDARARKFDRYTIPDRTRLKIADFSFMFPIMDIIYGSIENNTDLKDAAEVYFKLNDKLFFAWFRATIDDVGSVGYWDMLARSSLRDDLDKLQRVITMNILQSPEKGLNASKKIANWSETYRYLVNRWQYMVDELKIHKPEFMRSYIALRGLLDLVQASTSKDVGVAE